MEENIIERYSIIMKVRKDNTWFICNRNSNDFDNIFNDKYVRFWEVDDISYLTFSQCDGIEILECVPLDNYNRRHQKVLDMIKKKYIDKLLLENIELSNKTMTQIKKQYRTIYYEQWKDFYNTLMNTENIHDKIYDYAKKLFYTDKDNSWFYNMSRDEIWKNEKWNKEQKVIFILLRNYIYDRKYKLKSKYPFEKGYIHKKISKIIKDYYKP